MDDHQARKLEGVREPIVIGTFLWLCDERCLEAYATQPGRVYRSTPKRSPDEALRLSCAH